MECDTSLRPIVKIRGKLSNARRFHQVQFQYMLKEKIWKQVTDSREGLLCIYCVMIRLGRKLRPSDFMPVPINFRRDGILTLLFPVEFSNHNYSFVDETDDFLKQFEEFMETPSEKKGFTTDKEFIKLWNKSENLEDLMKKLERKRDTVMRRARKIRKERIGKRNPLKTFHEEGCKKCGITLQNGLCPQCDR